MKIVVLFGSFNPITNAHVGILKTALNSLEADKGLFVATNGKYLKRKAVKLGDAFYLTEDERREIIEETCQGESGLSFWGFELGGYVPSRYKTLCRIRKQYPDAEIIEVMGADKVHTLEKTSYGDDYVGGFRFAVFSRKGIDVQGIIDSTPLLARNRASFHLLPELEVGADISSTEVRRRFCAGQDYSDIVPESAAEVLGRHTPSDFTLTFADRIETMMNTGRYGPNNARKEIYAENTRLFNDWKNGAAELDLGDYSKYLNGTSLYDRPFDVTDLGTRYDSVTTGCINADCVDVAERLIAQGYDPAILNLASARKPGGGYRDGMGAQEESLCYASTLSLSLYQYGDPKYVNIRESGVPLKKVAYPLDLNWGGIYTPDVTFFRNNATRFYTVRDSFFKCDVITVAALSFNGRGHYADIDELSFRSENGGFTDEGNEIMLNKIRTVFRSAVEHGKDSLVLGALGCGAYKCPPDEVASQFRTVMNEPEFKNKFKLILFAIWEKPGRPNGLDGKVAPFYKEFGAHSL